VDGPGSGDGTDGAVPEHADRDAPSRSDVHRIRELRVLLREQPEERPIAMIADPAAEEHRVPAV